LELGKLNGGTILLKEAIANYEASRAERSFDRAPFDWAVTTASLGVARALLADRTGDVQMAKAALLQVEAALTTARRGGDHQQVAYCEAQLPTARAIFEVLNRR
jgi:hypothetical protein